MLDVSSVSKHYPTPKGPLTVLSDVTLALVGRRCRGDHGPSG
jgi:hypothetical protein